MRFFEYRFRPTRLIAGLCLLTIVALLTACGGASKASVSSTPSPLPTASSTATATPPPAPTATPLPAPSPTPDASAFADWATRYCKVSDAFNDRLDQIGAAITTKYGNPAKLSIANRKKRTNELSQLMAAAFADSVAQFKATSGPVEVVAYQQASIHQLEVVATEIRVWPSRVQTATTVSAFDVAEARIADLEDKTSVDVIKAASDLPPGALLALKQIGRCSTVVV